MTAVSHLTEEYVKKLLRTPIEQRPEGWEEALNNWYEIHRPNPILEDERIEIHPALDFDGDRAFVTQKLLYDDGMEQLKKPTLITSDRHLFILEKDREPELARSNIRLAYKPLVIKNRWSNRSIDYFLRTPTNHTEISLAYDKIREQLEYYFDWVDERLYDFFAVWFIGTYFFQLFNSYPYINLFGVKRCGKTKLLSVGSNISFNGLHVTGITPSTLFRIVQDGRCSLFIDEADYDKKDISDLRGLLTGYSKGILVPRATEKKRGGVRRFETEFYEVYSPKMLAGIQGLDNTLEDRCITIVLERPLDKVRSNRYPIGTETKWQEIRDICYSAMMENFKEIDSNYKDLLTLLTLLTEQGDMEVHNGNMSMSSVDVSSVSSVSRNEINDSVSSVSESMKTIAEHIDSRNLQLWLPLLSTAKAINVDVFENIVGIAIEVIDAKKDTELIEDYDTILFEYLIKNVTVKGFFKIVDLKNGLISEIGVQDWLTETKVGRMLRKLKVVLKAGSTGSRRMVWLEPDDIHKKALRFGIDMTRVEHEVKEEQAEKQSEVLDFTKSEDELEGEEFEIDSIS